MSDPNSNPMSDSSLMERAMDAVGGEDETESEVDETEGSESEESSVDDDVDSESEDEDSDESEDEEGSQGSPYNVKSLPDKYVTIKVDGKEEVVSLREMTDGYMRTAAFHKKVGDAQELAKSAKEAAEKFKSETKAIQTNFKALIGDPEEMYDFMETHAEETLDAMARMRLRQMIAESKDPKLKWQREHEKIKKTTEAENRRLREKVEQTERTQREEREHQKYLAAFKPGYEAGMKKAGYPKITEDFKVTFNGLLSAIRAVRTPTASDIEQAIIRTARAVDAETVKTRKPAPPPARDPAKKQPVPQKKAAAPKSFSQMFREMGGKSR